jgi:hypothetical protein
MEARQGIGANYYPEKPKTRPLVAVLPTIVRVKLDAECKAEALAWWDWLSRPELLRMSVELLGTGS